MSDMFGPNALWVGVFDALSARLVQRYEVDALWVSSYCVSASLKACRDASLVTASEMLDVSREIALAGPSLPVVVDCDSGYGDAEVFEFIVDRFCRTCPVQAVCIEDKPFPKRNSFYATRQSLDEVDDFAEKIRAARAIRDSLGSNLRIIARTEALVVGQTPSQALARLRAYGRAGCDGVVVQAKGKLDDLLRVMEFWKKESGLPIICIPTAFPNVSMRQFWDAGFDVVVYANFLLRSSTAATRSILDEMLLRSDRPPNSFRTQMASMQEIDDLVNENRSDAASGSGE